MNNDAVIICVTHSHLPILCLPNLACLGGGVTWMAVALSPCPVRDLDIDASRCGCVRTLTTTRGRTS